MLFVYLKKNRKTFLLTVSELKAKKEGPNIAKVVLITGEEVVKREMAVVVYFTLGIIISFVLFLTTSAFQKPLIVRTIRKACCSYSNSARDENTKQQRVEMKTVEIAPRGDIASIEEELRSRLSNKKIIRWYIAKVVDGVAHIEVIVM